MIDTELLVAKVTYPKLKHDSVDEVKISELKSSTLLSQAAYSERPSYYMVRLKGEKRWRRVYVTPIGNAVAYYIKTEHGNVGCETAVDEALHRV